MNIYHSYFRFWRNFPDKGRFCWIAVTKSVPPDYFGPVFKKLAPVDPRFDKWVEPVFNEKMFFIEYVKMLKEMDKKETLRELKSMSKHGKDIVLLNWEDLTRKSEGRVAYAWMLGMSMADADRMDLERVLAREKLGVDDRMFEI